ncbi:flavodoxin family protein [Georgenia muralis]|uniref:Flavodoxin-like protein n=1 Tax=Georgenia muralis TaxID=154117 RepID=A0A3N4ZCT8_9MICO|nr:flavodoxin domain-containing protein [Georgenia muralis]RPF29140.1 flavodoxin-like protein [Georgenia muralis]
MEMTVVYETVYGTTREVAEAIADGARGAGATVTVRDIADGLAERAPDLLVVGGPTHVRGMSTAWSRGKAAEDAPPAGAHEGGGAGGADAGVGDDAHGGGRDDADEATSQGVREWLAHLGTTGGKAATFDTHLGNPLAGGAARPIARALRRHGRDVIAREGFVLDGGKGPLRAGELDRARAWGAELAGLVA